MAVQVESCRLLSAPHFLVSLEISAVNSQVLAPFKTREDTWRNLQKASLAKKICGWMLHKEERAINLQDESPFKNRTHKSSIFVNEEHLISPQEMLLQTLLASFFLPPSETSLKIYWNYRTTCTTNAFVLKELFDAYGGNLRCFIAFVCRWSFFSSRCLWRKFLIDILFDCAPAQKESKNSFEPRTFATAKMYVNENHFSILIWIFY